MRILGIDPGYGITGYSIIDYAIESEDKLIVLTSGADLKPEQLKLARNKKVNIIKTNYKTNKDNYNHL